MFHWNWKWGVRFYYFTKFQIFNFIGTKKILLWIDNDVIRRFRTKCKATVNEFGRILLLTAMISAPAGTGSFSSFCGGCRRIITALPVGCMNRWRWIQPTNWNGLILRFRNRPFRPCVRCGSGNKNFFFWKISEIPISAECADWIPHASSRGFREIVLIRNCVTFSKLRRLTGSLKMPEHVNRI